MILHDRSQLGLKLSNDKALAGKVAFRQLQQVATGYDVGSKEFQIAENTTYELLHYDNKNRFELDHFLLTDTAMDMVKQIPLDEKFQIQFLKNLTDTKTSFLLGSEFTIRYWKDGFNIYALFFESKNDFTNWRFLRIDLENDRVVLPLKTANHNETIVPLSELKSVSNYLHDKEFKLFLQLVIFVSLSDVDIEFLKPNEKTGTKRSGKFLNQSKSDIQIVNSKWNTVSIRTESFKVNGHWRFQPCGIGMLERKLIWIDTFEKSGYIRNKARA